MNTEIIKTAETDHYIEAKVIDGPLCSRFLDLMGIARNLTYEEKERFIEIATLFQLNPFKREIYVVKFKDVFSILTGYEVYLKRAERSGRLAGWEPTIEGSVEAGNLVARCTVWRHDWTKPLTVEAWYEEYVQTTYINGKWQPNKMWASKPKTMLRKVAISQCFRMAFPDELGGMPYTQDEMPYAEADTTNDKTNVPQAVVDAHATRLEEEKERGKQEVKEKRKTRKELSEEDIANMKAAAEKLKLMPHAEIKEIMAELADYGEDDVISSTSFLEIVGAYIESAKLFEVSADANMTLRHLSLAPSMTPNEKMKILDAIKATLVANNSQIVYDPDKHVFLDSTL